MLKGRCFSEAWLTEQLVQGWGDLRGSWVNVSLKLPTRRASLDTFFPSPCGWC